MYAPSVINNDGLFTTQAIESLLCYNLGIEKSGSSSSTTAPKLGTMLQNPQQMYNENEVVIPKEDQDQRFDALNFLSSAVNNLQDKPLFEEDFMRVKDVFHE